MTQYVNSCDYRNIGNDILKTVSLTDENTNIQGGDFVIFDIAAPGAAREHVIENYDASLGNSYNTDAAMRTPHVIIRSKVNCSVNNVVIKDADGNTLYTFSTNDAALEKYCVLKRTDANNYGWTLA